MKNLKKILALILAFTMIFAFAACGQDGSNDGAADEVQTKLDQIKAAGKLVVGTSADYPPYEFHTDVDGQDTIVGFDMALAQYIADAIGVDLEIVDMGFDGLLIGLQNGDFDMVIAGLSPTEERQQVVDFSHPFKVDGQVVLVKTENADKITTTDDLMGIKCGYQTGTIQEGFAMKYCSENDAIGLVKFNDLIMELKNDNVSAVFSDKLVAISYASANEDLIVQDVGIEYDSEGFAIAMQKGNEDFVEYVNSVIDPIFSDGTMDKFVEEAVALAGVSEE